MYSLSGGFDIDVVWARSKFNLIGRKLHCPNENITNKSLSWNSYGTRIGDAELKKHGGKQLLNRQGLNTQNGEKL